MKETLKEGNTASLTRTFESGELAQYAQLCGEVYPDQVPEPLIGALFSCLLGVHLPGAGAMYLKQETQYLRPVQAGQALTASVELLRLRTEKYLADLETLCHDQDGQLVARGRALVYVREVLARQAQQ